MSVGSGNRLRPHQTNRRLKPMGAEMWIQFKSPKELERAAKFLGEIVGGSFVCGEIHTWIERRNKTSLRLSYKTSVYRHEVVMLVIRELSRRFAVTRIGADCVGWYPDSDWSYAETVEDYGPYKSWAEWVRDWKPEFFFRCCTPMPEVLGQLQQFDTLVSEQFSNLDKINALPDPVNPR